MVSTCDAKKLSRNINSKKSTVMHKIPSKLIKLSAKVLSKPLAIAVNKSFNEVMFPDNAKIACTSPLDKYTNDKHSLTFNPF